MEMDSQRLFVGNLPESATSDQVSSKFKNFGHVESVEIKHKKDANNERILSTFAYVNIRINPAELNSCIQLVNGIKWDGRHIKVDQAKEDFLQRLQRERLASQIAREKDFSALSLKEKTVSSSFSPKKENLKRKENDILSFESKSKSRIGPQQNISKKKENENKNLSVSSENEESNVPTIGSLRMFRGIKAFEEENSSMASKIASDEKKPVSKSQTNQKDDLPKPSYERPENSKDKIEHDAETAEKKRLKSVEEKRLLMQKQKDAVKHALSLLDGKPANKKITFNVDDDDVHGIADVKSVEGSKPVKRKKERWTQEQKDTAKQAKQSKSLKSQKTMSLFDDSDKEEDNSESESQPFKIKKQFEGKKGKKLLELQSRYNSDRRFTLDERFYESEDEGEEKQDSEKGDERSEDLKAEREQQLNILSEVLGHPVSSGPSPKNRESAKLAMLRFDPTKESHSKFEMKKTEDFEDLRKGKKNKSKNKIDHDVGEEGDAKANEENSYHGTKRIEKEPEPVSTETFYNVSDSLTESLKKAKEGQESGFSLLKMFGTPAEDLSKTKPSTQVEKPRVLSQVPRFSKAFLDESSDEDVECEGAETTAKTNTPAPANLLKSSSGVWQENFFFNQNDSRLKEAGDFFKVDAKPFSVESSEFTKKREALQRMVKSKLRNNQRKNTLFKTKLGSRNPGPKRLSQPSRRKTK